MAEDQSRPTRRGVTRGLLLAVPGAMIAAPHAGHAAPQRPSAAARSWKRFSTPREAGFTSDLSALSEALYPEPTTSFLVIRHRRIAYAYGNIAQVSYLASARKSILSMLYGRYVGNGLIRLDATLGQLGIDDIGGLLPIERTATVRDILTARSGVYHPASSPGSSADLPPRGSVTPGTRFEYNNWDFNVAGAIFERCTGRSVLGAFATDLAAPLEMEDFDPARQHMLHYHDSPSRYPAYHFFLSARDMARLGVTMLDRGRWNGRQVVPSAWVADSTRLHVRPDEIAMLKGAFGYGYLWWIPAAAQTSPGWTGSYAAMGNYGQVLLVLPALDMVIVHRRAVTDEFAFARNEGLTTASPAGGEPHVMALMDMVVKALPTAGNP